MANGMAIRYDILHSLSFVAVMTRNLFPGQTGLIPDVSVKLEITDEILVRFTITHSGATDRGGAFRIFPYIGPVSTGGPP